jgi:transposase-like protein
MNQIRKKYSKEFKAQAVELAQAGRPVSELAVELEVGTNLIYRWMKNSEGAQLGGKPDRAVGEEGAAAELRSLRGENSLLKLENDILKKAAVILGTSHQPKGVR